MEDTERSANAAQPQEQPKEGRAAWRGRALWVVVLVAAFALLNAGITYVFEYYGCSAELTWTQYRMVEQGTLDTVSLGTSVALQAFDPYVLDEHLDSNTFNLSFYGLAHRYSARALERALAEHPIKRVYIGLSPSSMGEGEYDPASAMFTQYKMVGEPLAARLEDLGFLLAGGRLGISASLEVFFPWTINNLGNDPETVRENVHKRLTYSVEQLADGSLEGKDTSKGFRPFEKHVLDSDGIAQAVEVPQEGEGNVFSQTKIDDVARIAQICQEAGVELYVLVMPQPTYEVLTMGAHYPDSWGSVRDAVTSHGATFIDMNLVRPETFAFAEEEFCDTQHLNAAGAQRFSAFFAELVGRIEAGEDVSADFFGPYDEWDAYLASIDHIELVNFTTELAGDTVSVEAHLYAGPQVEAEYALEELDEQTGTYKTITEYGASPHFAIPADGQRHTLRVLAREQGSDVPYDHWCQREVVAG